MCAFNLKLARGIRKEPYCEDSKRFDARLTFNPLGFHSIRYNLSYYSLLREVVEKTLLKETVDCLKKTQPPSCERIK